MLILLHRERHGSWYGSRASEIYLIILKKTKMLVEIGMDLYSCQTCKDFSGNIYVSDNDYLKKKKY